MSLLDTNKIIRDYLTTSSTKVDPLIALVGARIYCPRIPENGTLPAVTYSSRGGSATPYIPDMPNPSMQFDCWAADPIDAREIYRALYDALQGIQNVAVGSNYILSAIEEGQGQDLVDMEIPNYFRTLTFFSIMLR